jgi:MFS family permease
MSLLKNREILQEPKSIKPNQMAVKKANMRPYRTWPVYVLAFLKPLYQSLFGLALPNYLIYETTMEPELIGVISSSTALVYILSPFLGLFIAKKIGRKNTLLISLFLSAITYNTQILFFGPSVLIVSQLVEGIGIGLFWPVLMMEFSSWQKISTTKQNNENFRHFNISWNLGLLGGFMIGFLLVVLWKNDFVALIASCVMVFALIPVGFFLESDKKFLPKNNLKDGNILSSPYIAEDKTTLNKNRNPKKLSQISLIHLAFPAFIAWILNFYYTTAKSMYHFIFPFNLLDNGFESYWRYIFIFAQQGFQILGLNWIGSRSVKNKKNVIIWLLVFDTLCALIMVFTSNIFFIIISTILLGLSTGLKQGVVMRINFDYSSHTGKSKYINLGELTAGIGFGITPLWVSIFVTIDYHFSYIILGALSTIILGIYLLSIRNFHEKREKLNNV